MNIVEAVKQLDPDNDNHWTADGAPRIDAVSDILGRTTTREAITLEMPGYGRAAAQEAAFGLTEEPPKTKAPDEIPVVQATANTDSVLNRPIVEILNSLELTEKAFAEIEATIAELTKARAAIDAKLDKLYTYSETLSRARDRLVKSDPNRAVKDIQAYLNRNKAVRAEKSKRARSFLEAGTNARDVRELLDPRSKIDQAMAQRKPAPGSQRPNVTPSLPS